MIPGNGRKDCPQCNGRGVVSLEYLGIPGGATRVCDCMYVHDVLVNVERIWAGLSKAPPIAKSPLTSLDLTQNYIVTSSLPMFRMHLRHMAVRKGPRWDAKVVADAALATAWLATKVGVFDADVLQERERVVSEEHLTLVDIAVPYQLLIIQLGVKAAKNREMPGVLLEVLQERMHRDLPTWLVETPGNPLRDGHICYDVRVGDLLESWTRVDLGKKIESVPKLREFAPRMPTPVPLPEIEASSREDFGLGKLVLEKEVKGRGKYKAKKKETNA